MVEVIVKFIEADATRAVRCLQLSPTSLCQFSWLAKIELDEETLPGLEALLSMSEVFPECT